MLFVNTSNFLVKKEFTIWYLAYHMWGAWDDSLHFSIQKEDITYHINGKYYMFTFYHERGRYSWNIPMSSVISVHLSQHANPCVTQTYTSQYY